MHYIVHHAVKMAELIEMPFETWSFGLRWAQGTMY